MISPMVLKLNDLLCYHRTSASKEENLVRITMFTFEPKKTIEWLKRAHLMLMEGLYIMYFIFIHEYYNVCRSLFYQALVKFYRSNIKAQATCGQGKVFCIDWKPIRGSNVIPTKGFRAIWLFDQDQEKDHVTVYHKTHCQVNNTLYFSTRVRNIAQLHLKNRVDKVIILVVWS